jgi:hypothetical protein
MRKEAVVASFQGLKKNNLSLESQSPRQDHNRDDNR